MSRILFFDSESDGLLPWATKIWCISYKFLGSALVTLTPETLHEFSDVLDEADTVVAHHELGHDLPLMLKCGIIKSFTIGPDTINGKPKKIVDSLTLSRYLYPDRPQHGLEYWGELCGVAKPVHNQWDRLSDEMIHRNRQDVLITEQAYLMLLEEMK